MLVVSTFSSIVSSYATLVATVVLKPLVDMFLTDIWSFGIPDVTRRCCASPKGCTGGFFSSSLPRLQLLR